MKARIYQSRPEAIFLAKNGTDHVWRFTGNTGEYAYLGNKLTWLKVSPRQNRKKALLEDQWEQVKSSDFNSILMAYTDGESWAGFKSSADSFLEDEDKSEDEDESEDEDSSI